MIPKAVIFDLGKVLLDFDYGLAIGRIQEHSHLSRAELHALINQSPLLLRYESNAISTAQFFAEVQAASGFTGTLQDFEGMFADIFTAIEPMVRLQQNLRAARVSTYIFSNTNDLAVRHIRQRFPFFADFDGHVLSYEHHAMKPDAQLYRVVERMAGVRDADLLYIDDRPENIATGQELGWRTILHRDPEETAAAVRAHGLLA